MEQALFRSPQPAGGIDTLISSMLCTCIAYRIYIWILSKKTPADAQNAQRKSRVFAPLTLLKVILWLFQSSSRCLVAKRSTLPSSAGAINSRSEDRCPD